MDWASRENCARLVGLSYSPLSSRTFLVSCATSLCYTKSGAVAKMALPATSVQGSHLFIFLFIETTYLHARQLPCA